MTEGPSATPPEGGGKVENPRQGGDYAPSVATRLAMQPESRRDRRAVADDAPRLLHRRPRRAGDDGEEPAHDLQGDLRGLRAQLVPRGGLVRDRDPLHRIARLVPVGHVVRLLRGAESPADADRLCAARPHRARGRVRLPLRDVQHRRPGPVPRRLDHGRLGWLGVAEPPRAPAHPARRRRGRPRRGGLGRDRRAPEGDGRSARGDLDDHAQLHRPLGRASSSSGSAARSRTTTRAANPCPSPTTSSTRRS